MEWKLGLAFSWITSEHCYSMKSKDQTDRPESSLCPTPMQRVFNRCPVAVGMTPLEEKERKTNQITTKSCFIHEYFSLQRYATYFLEGISFVNSEKNVAAKTITITITFVNYIQKRHLRWGVSLYCCLDSYIHRYF